MTFVEELISRLSKIAYESHKAEHIHWLVMNAELEGYDKYSLGDWIRIRIVNEEMVTTSNVMKLPIPKDEDDDLITVAFCKEALSSEWPMDGFSKKTPADIREALGPMGGFRGRRVSDLSKGELSLWSAICGKFRHWKETQKKSA